MDAVIAQSEHNAISLVDMIHMTDGSRIISKLSISLCPGKQDSLWNRNLDSDLSNIKSLGITVIVCLLEWNEMRMLNISDFPNKAKKAGFIFYHFPIKDRRAPKQGDLKIMIPIIIQHLKENQNVLVHCRAGLGRSGTISACCLVNLGYLGKDAINIVRQRRPGAIQTEYQEKCILKYTP